MEESKNEVEVRYDVPIEVTKTQYDLMLSKLDGIVCGRHDEVNGKFYVKCWNIQYKKLVSDALKNIK